MKQVMLIRLKREIEDAKRKVEDLVEIIAKVSNILNDEGHAQEAALIAENTCDFINRSSHELFMASVSIPVSFREDV